MEGEFPEQMKCPICFEIPEREIFQCKNGHTVCDVCSENVSRCPQCRVNFGNNNKIRNRALENLLDMINYHCPFKENGCNKKVARGNITEHSESCQFGGDSAPFCSLFGFDCYFMMHTRKQKAAISHLRNTHRASYRNGNFILARFKNFYHINFSNEITWTPLIINVYNIHLMVIVTYRDDNVGLNCFSFDELPSNFLVEFRFLGKSNLFPEIKWLTSPTCYTRCEIFLVSYPHRTSVNLLQDGYLKNKNLNVQIFVHGDSFPYNSFQPIEYVDMEVEFD